MPDDFLSELLESDGWKEARRGLQQRRAETLERLAVTQHAYLADVVREQATVALIDRLLRKPMEVFRTKGPS